MKHNFILTEQNSGEFLKRFIRMLSYSSMLIESGKYRGVKNLNSVLPEDRNYSNGKMVDQTSNSYYDLYTIEFDTFPAGLLRSQKGWKGIIIRANSDEALVIKFGTKIHFSPREIKIQQFNEHYGKSGRTYVLTLKPFWDINKGKQENRYREFSSTTILG